MGIATGELKQSPSLNRIGELIREIKTDTIESGAGSKTLEVYNALINHTIPEVYNEMPADLRSDIVDIMRTVSGLSTVVTRIGVLLQGDSDDLIPEDVAATADVLCGVVNDIVDRDGLEIIWNRKHNKEKAQFLTLIYGSKLFSIASKAFVKLRSTNRSWTCLASTDRFGKFLADSILKLQTTEGLEKSIKIGGNFNMSFGKKLLGDSTSREQVLPIYKSLRNSQQWLFLRNIVLPHISSMKSTIDVKIKILREFSTGHEDTLYRYPESLGSIDISLCRLVVKCTSPSRTMVQDLIGRWGGNELTVKHNPIPLQEVQTIVLLLSLTELTDSDCEFLAFSPEFLNSITNRLGGLSSRIRLYGTAFGEELTKRTRRPLKFDLQLDKEEQARLRSYASCENDSIQNTNDGEDDSDDDDGSATINAEVAKRPVELPVYAMPENDEEDSDDDPTLATRERIAAPVYIKDLIRYLGEEEKYDYQYLALTQGTDLVKRKRAFGKEMEFYGEALASAVAGLKDNFNMKDFGKMQINLLVEVARTPTVGPLLAKLLFSGDFSLQQRMIILTSIALAVSPETSESPVLASKQLPPAIHDLFSDSPSVDSLARQIQSSSLKDTGDKADELIGGPKILRISRQLTNKHDKESNNVVTTSETAGKYYFFPLVGQWYSNGGVNLGNYSQLLVAHFFKTLAIIMSKAKTTDRPDMTSELLDLIMGMRIAASTEPTTLDGVLTALLIILQTNEPEFLVTHWPTQVVEIKTWLEDTWRDVPDEKIQQTAAAALYQLVEILDKWGQRLIGAW